MKLVVSAIALCSAALLSSAALSSQAQAGSASGSWVGPHGGTVHYHGHRGPNRYRGAVTFTTPDGRTFRRVTKVRRGPHGQTYVSRRWVGPDGAYYRGRVIY